MKAKLLLHTPLTEELVERGYCEVDKLDDESDAEHCWHLCNWVCWAIPYGVEFEEEYKYKPKELFSDIPFCGHGLVVINPETNKWFLALSCGWLCGTEEEIRGYIHRHHKEDMFWDMED